MLSKYLYVGREFVTDLPTYSGNGLIPEVVSMLPGNLLSLEHESGRWL